MGPGVDPTPPSNAEVKERVEIYFYSPLCDFMAGYRIKFTAVTFLKWKKNKLLCSNLHYYSKLSCLGIHSSDRQIATPKLQF
jgi:hypothetical protein